MSDLYKFRYYIVGWAETYGTSDFKVMSSYLANEDYLIIDTEQSEILSPEGSMAIPEAVPMTEGDTK